MKISFFFLSLAFDSRSFPFESKICRIFRIFFFFLETCPHFANFSRNFRDIFGSSLDRRLDNNARKLLFRGIAGLVDFSSDRQPRVDGTRKRGNERVDQMTSSRQREGPPAKGVHGGRGGGRGLVAGTIVAVPRGGSSRLNGPSPWEASRRPFSLYNFNSRVDDFASRSERANTRSLSFLSFPSPFSLSLLFFFCFCFCNQGSRKQLPLKATWLF